ncbi:MAG TPA: hypothetical protein VMR45_04760 [Patescibacteria group bacterium]|nr:hypothetical protein [Patescibacteria group bacterium]
MSAGDVAFTDMLQKVRQLDISERIYTHMGHEILFDLSDAEDCVQGKVTLLRDDGIPAIGSHNSMAARALELAENEGVQEASHFVYLPEKHIMAFEYNQFGPRIGLFFKVVNALYEQNFTLDSAQPPFAKWSYIQSGTAMDKLSRSRSIKMIEINYVDGHLNNDGNVGVNQVLNTLADIDDVKTVALTLKGQRGSRNPIMATAHFIQRFLPHGEQSLPNYEKLKVKVINSVGSTEVIDLFEDKVMVEITAVKLGRSRQLDTRDLFEKVTVDIRSRSSELV